MIPFACFLLDGIIISSHYHFLNIAAVWYTCMPVIYWANSGHHCVKYSLIGDKFYQLKSWWKLSVQPMPVEHENLKTSSWISKSLIDKPVYCNTDVIERSKSDSYAKHAHAFDAICFPVVIPSCLGSRDVLTNIFRLPNRAQQLPWDKLKEYG